MIQFFKVEQHMLNDLYILLCPQYIIAFFFYTSVTLIISLCSAEGSDDSFSVSNIHKCATFFSKYNFLNKTEKCCLLLNIGVNVNNLNFGQLLGVCPPFGRGDHLLTAPAYIHMVTCQDVFYSD